jgi:hypothetical protein
LRVGNDHFVFMVAEGLHRDMKARRGRLQRITHFLMDLAQLRAAGFAPGSESAVPNDEE